MFSNSCPFATAGKHQSVELDVQECNQPPFLISQAPYWNIVCSSVNQKEKKKSDNTKNVNDKLHSQSKPQAYVHIHIHFYIYIGGL